MSTLIYPGDLGSKDLTLWSTDELNTFLKANQSDYDLDDETIERLEEVKGKAFLKISEEGLRVLKVTKVQAAMVLSLRNDLRAPPAAAAAVTGFRKRPAEEDLIQRKKFKPNGAILEGLREHFYYADQTESNCPLIERIEKGALIRLYGPRASGKTSRLVELKRVLECDKQHECIFVDFHTFKVEDQATFWSNVDSELRPFRLPCRITSLQTFLEAFQPNPRWDRPVILLLDEFDVLYSTTAKDTCGSVLSALRTIRNDISNTKYVVKSVVAVGTFAITRLKQDNMARSPFNNAEDFSGIALSKSQVQELFGEFARDYERVIEVGVIDHIYEMTRGHAGLVSICGAEMHNPSLFTNGTLTLSNWERYFFQLPEKIYTYSTFNRMVEDLIRQKDAVDCLRRRFLSNFDNYIFVPREEERLAEFLATLGVLSPDGSQYKMSSPIIDSLVRMRVIPTIYPTAPTIPIPEQYAGGPLDFVSVLREALKVFDRELMKRVVEYAYKTVDVMVSGHKKVKVPRESVYDSELMRILSNWLHQACYKVTSQWHLMDNGNHRYSDIIIYDDTSKIVLELLATGERAFIQEHIDRADKYKTNLGASEAWVVHFTCEDDYLRHPLWQSEALVNKHINIVHVMHDREFKGVRIGARYMMWDGNVQLIENELVF